MRSIEINFRVNGVSSQGLTGNFAKQKTSLKGSSTVF